MRKRALRLVPLCVVILAATVVGVATTPEAKAANTAAASTATRKWIPPLSHSKPEYIGEEMYPPSCVKPGAMATYTMGVINNFSNRAVNVDVYLPAGLHFGKRGTQHLVPSSHGLLWRIRGLRRGPLNLKWFTFYPVIPAEAASNPYYEMQIDVSYRSQPGYERHILGTPANTRCHPRREYVGEEIFPPSCVRAGSVAKYRMAVVNNYSRYRVKADVFMPYGVHFGRQGSRHLVDSHRDDLGPVWHVRNLHKLRFTATGQKNAQWFTFYPIIPKVSHRYYEYQVVVANRSQPGYQKHILGTPERNTCP